MENFKILHVPCGIIGTNTYIVYQEGGSDAAVIDPAEGTAVMAVLKKYGLRCSCILLTHGHFDHVMGVEPLKARYDCPVVIGKKDLELIADPAKGLAKELAGLTLPPLAADRTVGEGDVVEAAGVTFRVIDCPGHTAGGVSYLAGDTLFCGDTLFRRSIGRTDFPGGSFDELSASIQKLYRLKDEVRVLPGHGEPTTIGEEATENPYVRRG